MADDEIVCDYCGDGDTEPDDPVAHFKDPTQFGRYVMAHGQCGEDQGLELA